MRCKLVILSLLLMISVRLSAQSLSKTKLEAKVDSVLSLMTLEEKIGQMVQYSASWDVTGPPTAGNENRLENLKRGLVGSMLNVTGVKATKEAQRLNMENSRLKIPLIFGYDVIHGYKTLFPIPLGESASWDLDIMERTARAAARESAAAGIGWTFAPMVDVSRDARWGRIMEGAGEDPFLVAKIGVARVKGFQTDDLTSPTAIAACAKHFAGYGFAEAGRDYNTVNLGMSELHNTILPPFKAAADAGVLTFMNSFNEIDGIPSTGNPYLQREILKEEWNYKGFIVSDWGSISEMIAHGVAENHKEAAYIALTAGSDMDMEGNAYETSIEDLIKEGRVSETLVDDAVKRILRVKFQLGLFDDPYKYCDAKAEKKELYSKENQQLSLEAGKKSIVLLKNENALLPIASKVKTIAVIGPLADDNDSPLGNWRGQGVSNSAVSVLEGIRRYAPKGTKVTYAKGADLSIGERSFLKHMTINETDTSGFGKAVETAKEADLVILVVGEDAFQTGEARSQTDIGFAGVQDELIKVVYKANSNVVMVLMNGRPMDISWSAANIPTILESWLLGSQHGNAVAEVLFGKYNPSGKLPVSFPRSVGQEPLYYNQKNTGRPGPIEDVTYSHYVDERRDALYPFGYGLSYTTFKYDNISLSASSFSEGEPLTVTVSVTNTGKLDGEEVVQLYLRDLVASTTRPIKELKGFEKVFIKAGETKKVIFTIDRELLSFYTRNKKWEAESGDFKVFVGGNSVDVLEASFKYKNE
ncbi:beta-glucosidase BglX [Neptunitalea chrysea]|nr:beta-glucosidase BglX [Neptunitalea chrysea]